MRLEVNEPVYPKYQMSSQIWCPHNESPSISHLFQVDNFTRQLEDQRPGPGPWRSCHWRFLLYLAFHDGLICRYSLSWFYALITHPATGPAPGLLGQACLCWGQRPGAKEEGPALQSCSSG